MERNLYGKRARSVWGPRRGRGWREEWAAHPECAHYVVNNPYRCWFAEALRLGRFLLGTCEAHPYRLRRQIPRDICWYNPKECA
jgi:hypothetical protein